MYHGLCSRQLAFGVESKIGTGVGRHIQASAGLVKEIGKIETQGPIMLLFVGGHIKFGAPPSALAVAISSGDSSSIE